MINIQLPEEELDFQLGKIQRSTRTLMPVFIRPHNWLRSKSRLYYNWHLCNFAKLTHWVILLVYICSISLVIGNVFNHDDSSKALGAPGFVEDFSTTNYRDALATTSAWNISAKKVNSSYVMDPIETSALNNPLSDGTTNAAAYVANSPTDNNHKTFIFNATNIYKYDPDSSNSRVSIIAAKFNTNNLTVQSAIYSPANDKIYILTIISGYSPSTIWQFDVATETLTKLKDPQDRDLVMNDKDYSSVYDSNNQLIYFSQGDNGEGECTGNYCASGQIYALDPLTNQLTLIKDREPNPGIIYGGGPRPLSDPVALTHGGLIYYNDNGTNYLYFLGGQHPNWDPVCYEYDPVRDENGDPVLDGDGNYVYNYTDAYCIGWDNPEMRTSAYTTKIVRYNLDTKQVDATFSADLPQMLMDFNPVQVSLSDYYFYGGKNDSGNLDSIYYYNPANPSQVTLLDSKLPTATMNLKAVYDKDKNQTYLLTYPLLNIASIDSNKIINFSTIANGTPYFANRSGAACAQVGNFGYVFGGGYSSDQTSIDKFDFTTDKITHIGTNNLLAYGQKAIAANDGMIYIFGGTGHATTIYKFDPETEQLTTVGDYLDTGVNVSSSLIYDAQNNAIDIFAYSSSLSHFVMQKYPVGQASAITEAQIYDIAALPLATVRSYLINRRVYLFRASNSTAYFFNLDDPARSISLIAIGPVGTLAFLAEYNGKIYKNYYPPKYGTQVAELTPNSEGSSFSVRNLDLTTYFNNYFAISFVKDGYFYLFNTAGAMQKFNPLYPKSSIAQSKKINSTPVDIYQATLSSEQDTPAGTSIDYEMSADGGSHWESITLNTPHTFSAIGSDLRWRARLNNTETSTPDITKVSVSYLGRPSSLYLFSGSTTLTAGQPGIFTLGLKDASGNTTNAEGDLNINLSSSSSSGHFSSYINGNCSDDWENSLLSIFTSGNETLAFCYYDTSLTRSDETHTITASALGLNSANIDLHINSGPVSTLSPVNVSAWAAAGNVLPVTITLKDNQGNALSGKTMHITSTRKTDTISQPIESAASPGRYVGNITSTKTGNSTLTVKDVTDNIWLGAHPQISFVPAEVSSMEFANQPTNVGVGNPFDFEITLKDTYGNIATNALGKITFSSSDRRAMLPANYTLADSDAGRHIFSDISFKTAGLQKLTLNYREDNYVSVDGALSFVVSPDTVSATISMISADKTTLTADSKDSVLVTVTLYDAYTNPISGKAVKLKSSRNSDVITSASRSGAPIGVTSVKGETYFRVSTGEAGTMLLSAIDTTDHLVLDQSLSINVTSSGAISAILDTLKNNDTIKKAVTRVLAPLAQGAAAVGVIPVIVQSIAALPSVFQFFAYLFALLMEALGIKKRPRPWGTVFDSITGKPVDLAVIRLFDANTMRLVATRVSDLSGRFGFSVEPGLYVASVAKPGYLFPITKNTMSNLTNGQYYIGSPIHIEQKMDNLSLSIPIEPVKTRVSVFSRLRIMARDISEWISISSISIFVPIFIFGILVSMLSAYVSGGTKAYALVVLYIALMVIYLITRQRLLSHHGTVLGETTDLVNGGRSAKDKLERLDGAIVHLFDVEFRTLRASVQTNKFGRFTLYAPAGRYYLTCNADGYNMVTDAEAVASLSQEGHRADTKLAIRKDRFYNGGVIELRSPGYINAVVRMKKGSPVIENAPGLSYNNNTAGMV